MLINVKEKNKEDPKVHIKTDLAIVGGGLSGCVRSWQRVKGAMMVPSLDEAYSVEADAEG